MGSRAAGWLIVGDLPFLGHQRVRQDAESRGEQRDLLFAKANVRCGTGRKS
jgi:hypothetical protein